MKAPNVWGQGALFAFSGLEGKTDFRTQLVGVLLGDHPGIHFGPENAFELYADTTGTSEILWDAVTSDVISGTIRIDDIGYRLCFVFRSNATVAGICPAGRIRLIFDSGIADNAVTLTRTEDEGECFFCLSREGDVNCSRAVIENEIRERLAFYDRLDTLLPDGDLANTFAHAVSVMKSQVYTAEKPFRQLWTTPDRYPHKRLWLWDSCFHSFGNYFIRESLAMDSILSVLDSQLEDGFIPHMTSPCEHSAITEPPVIAWSVEKYVLRTGNTVFAAKCFDALEKYLTWNRNNRRTESGLYYWHINRDSDTCRCDESGMDNCSRFDNVEEMECIDFSCFMIRESQAMSTLAGLLGKKEAAEYWKNYAQELADLVNTRLWDEEDGFYYDFELKTKTLHKVRSIASFLPLFSGICTAEQREKLIRALTDETQFKAVFSIPGISLSDPTFGTDMWCGPVWINYVYMVIEGLKRCGEVPLAEALIRNTVDGIVKHYVNSGVLYEFYDSTERKIPPVLRRKGTPVLPYTMGSRTQSIRDYGWTASLFVAFLLENKELFCR